jgi:hypothetical protein
MAEFKGITVYVDAAERDLDDAEITAQLGGTPQAGDIFTGCRFIGDCDYNTPIGLRTWIADLTFRGCSFHGTGLWLWGTPRPTVRGCDFHNVIGGGNGFCLWLVGAYGGLYENLSFEGCERSIFGTINTYGSVRDSTFRDIVIHPGKNVGNSGESFDIHGQTLTAINLHAATAATRVNNVATYTVAAGSEWLDNLSAGDKVIVAGCADASFNGTFTVRAGAVRQDGTFAVDQAGVDANSSTNGATALPLYGFINNTMDRIRIEGYNSNFMFWATIVRDVTITNLYLVDGASLYIFAEDAAGQPYFDIENLVFTNCEFNGPMKIWSYSREAAVKSITFNNPCIIRSRSIAGSGNPSALTRIAGGTYPIGQPAWFTAVHATDAGGDDWGKGIFRDTAVELTTVTLNNPRWWDFDHAYIPNQGPNQPLWTTGRPTDVRNWPAMAMRKGGTIAGTNRTKYTEIFGVGQDQSGLV